MRKVTHKTARGFDALCDSSVILSDDSSFNGCFRDIAHKNGYLYGYSINNLSVYEIDGDIIRIEKVTKPSDEEIYHKMYETWLKLNDVKVGDMMKIIRIPNEFDKGFNCTFCNKDRIGEIHTVINIDNKYLCFGKCNVPYFCLEKVGKPEVFYKLGDKFRNTKGLYSGDEFMLFKKEDQFNLINLNNAGVWNGWKTLTMSTDGKITEKEISKLFGRHPFEKIN